MDAHSILLLLQEMSRPDEIPGMARFGIPPARNLGVRIPELRKLARTIRRNSPPPAQELWDLGYRETRLLAGMIQDPEALAEQELEGWLADFDSWEITDGTILNCFYRHPLACRKALEWSHRQEEFPKRAGFVLMAILAVKDRKLEDDAFAPFLDAIVREATDPRNFVRKGVNWALRQIGKRNAPLHGKAVKLAEQLAGMENRTARWIAADALRELRSPAVLERVRSR